MKFKHLLVWIPPIAGLALLTGGFGAFAPPIEGLSRTCGDYCGGRLLWVIGIGLLPLTTGLVLRVVAGLKSSEPHGRAAIACFLWCVSVVASGFVNDRLDQDPLAAWLNWESPYLDYHPEWGHSIENHEQIYRDSPGGKVYAGRGA